MTQINPELRARWERFQADQSRKDLTFFRPYRDQGGAQPMPENYRRSTREFKRSVPEIPWERSRFRSEVKLAKFMHESFEVSVRVEFDEADLEFIGSFHNNIAYRPANPTRAGWNLRNKTFQYPRCKGPQHRHSWRYGTYDRKHMNLQGRGEYRYGVLENYDYEEVRNGFWHQGYSKAEADLLARRAFQEAVQEFERAGSGQECYYRIEVQTRLPDDDAILGEDSCGSILYDDTTQLNELVWESVAEACTQARRSVAQRRHELSALLERYDTWLATHGSVTSSDGIPAASTDLGSTL